MKFCGRSLGGVWGSGLPCLIFISDSILWTFAFEDDTWHAMSLSLKVFFM